MKEECVSVCGHFFFFPKRVLFHCATSQMRSCCKQLCHQGNRTSAPCFNLTTEKLGGRQTRNKRWKEENYILSPVERSQQGPEHAAKQSTTVVWNDKILQTKPKETQTAIKQCKDLGKIQPLYQEVKAQDVLELNAHHLTCTTIFKKDIFRMSASGKKWDLITFYTRYDIPKM